MIWLTWRQFRVQAIAAAAAVAVLGIIFGVTGPHLAHLYDISGLASCRTGCSALTSNFLDSVKADAAYPVLYIAGLGILYLTPALIGMFWGAPLVTRELEAGTFRLAWNQSVTRTRWMAVKLAAGGLAAMVTTGLLSLVITWWASPVDRAGIPTSFGQLSRFSPVAFGARNRPGQLRRVRLRPRGHRRRAHPPHPARHGRHSRRLCRRPAHHAQRDPAASAAARHRHHGGDRQRQHREGGGRRRVS